MRMDIPAAVMKTDIPAEAVAEDVVPSHLSQVLMSEKPAVHITEEPLMTEHSSILPYDRGEPLEFICGAGQMIKRL